MAKKRRSHKRSHSRRRSNPFRLSGRKVKRYRRRNPSGISGTIRDLSSLMLWGTAGAVAARALPQMLLGSGTNTGVVGWGANLLTAIVGGGLVGKFAGPGAGAKFTAGGVIGAALRIFSDTFSAQAAQYGLSGDSGFELGFYIPNSFPSPTTGSGPFLLQPGQTGSPMAAGGVAGSPIAAISAPSVAAGAPGSTDEPQRWASRWAA